LQKNWITALYLSVNSYMKRFFFIAFFLVSFFSVAQDTTTQTNLGTIKVTKKGILHSVIYDDVYFRLVCKDIYGNIADSAVISFEVNVTVKGIAYSEKVTGPFLSKTMQQKLSRMDGVTTLFFSDIKAKEKNGIVVTFPDFKSQTGHLRENTDY
jgi:hypothetical protein